jgi:uncharacterized protein YjiS (DUF1127 family)
MAYSLTSERPAVAARPTTLFAGLVTWLADAKAKRTQRVALAALLDFDEAMLDDLGVSRQDIAEAIRHPNGDAGTHLHSRRASRAKAWFQLS